MVYGGDWGVSGGSWGVFVMSLSILFRYAAWSSKVISPGVIGIESLGVMRFWWVEVLGVPFFP